MTTIHDRDGVAWTPMIAFITRRPPESFWVKTDDLARLAQMTDRAAWATAWAAAIHRTPPILPEHD